MPPSLKFKVLTFKFERIMKENKYFNESEVMIEMILKVMQVFFTTP